MWLAVVKAWISEDLAEGISCLRLVVNFLLMMIDVTCYCRQGGGMGVLQTCCLHMILGHRDEGIFALVW